MSLQVIALLLVTIGFTVLAIRVFAPRNKSYYEAMAKIPLDGPAESTKEGIG